MYFKSTYFHNFRNLESQRLLWTQGVNLITGSNGSGKTNFLEGLNIVSGWGPFERGERLSNLIRWGDGEAARSGLFAGAGGEDDFEVSALISSRCSLKRDNRVIGATDMRNILPVLSFLYGHVSLIKGGASYRRQMLDRIGALISPSYALRLHEYKKAFRQKSALLRKYSDTKIVDRVLLKIGGWIWTAREEICRMIKSCIGEFSGIQSHDMDMTFIRGGGGQNDDPYTDFKVSLCQKIDRERQLKTVLVGPQRDDLKLTCGGRDASSVLSRGQSRRASFAITMASALVVERVLKRRPILVLDEITSELDEAGTEVIFKTLAESGLQVFAAATAPVQSDRVTVYKVKNGRFI